MQDLKRATRMLIALTVLTGVVYPLAVTGMFIGIGKIGPSHTSFLFNFEPIAVVIMSGPILGQALSASQLVGAALVIGAIVMLQWPARLSPRP